MTVGTQVEITMVLRTGAEVEYTGTAGTLTVGLALYTGTGREPVGPAA